MKVDFKNKLARLLVDVEKFNKKEVIERIEKLGFSARFEEVNHGK